MCPLAELLDPHVYSCRGTAESEDQEEFYGVHEFVKRNAHGQHILGKSTHVICLLHNHMYV